VNIPRTADRSPASPGILTVFPVLEVRGDLLVWDFRDVKEKPSPRNLLERFCSLYRLEDDAILKFARSSGPLGHCQHGRLGCCPEWHNVEGTYFADSIEGWRRLSAIIAGLCRAAVRVAQLRPGLPSDWMVYPGQQHWPFEKEPWRSLSASRFTLEQDVNACLELGRVRPGITWQKGRWEFYMRSHLIPTLYGELAQQLLLQTSNVDGIQLCDGCGDAYMPDRRPNPHRRRYCLECQGRKVPQRDAKRAKRSRDRKPL
jgi:hypothetical protein